MEEKKTRNLLATTTMSEQQLHDLRMREATKGMNMTERVAAWYVAELPFTLTAAEDEIRRRWELARQSFLDGKTYTQIANALVEEFGISIQMAKIDIRNMRNAFPKGDETTRDMHRERALEMVLKAYSLAAEEENTKQMISCAKQYALITGLDKSDQDKVDLEKIMKERTYVEVLDPQLRDMLMSIVSQAGGSLDTSKLFEGLFVAKNAEYAEHEEV